MKGGAINTGTIMLIISVVLTAVLLFFIWKAYGG